MIAKFGHIGCCANLCFLKHMQECVCGVHTDTHISRLVKYIGLETANIFYMALYLVKGTHVHVCTEMETGDLVLCGCLFTIADGK